MVLLPVLLLTLFPAGFFFLGMANRRNNDLGKEDIIELPTPLVSMRATEQVRFHFAS